MEKVLTELREQLNYAEVEDAGDEGYAQEIRHALEILGKIEEDGHMYENTLTGLLQAGHSYFARHEADYMVVWVEGVTPKPEMIINTKDNWENKLKYYAETYTEGLCLKFNENIKIAKFGFVTSSDISNMFYKSDVTEEVLEIQRMHQLDTEE